MDNIIDLIKAIKNPREFVLNNPSVNSNPMLQNLVKMAENGNTKGVEDFARNIFKTQGRDFDKEYNDLMSNFK